MHSFAILEMYLGAIFPYSVCCHVNTVDRMEHSVATYFQDVLGENKEPSLLDALGRLSENQLRKGKAQLEKEFLKQLHQLDVPIPECQASDRAGQRCTDPRYGRGTSPPKRILQKPRGVYMKPVAPQSVSLVMAKA
jgi:hypothetical protein